jgi:hypothetical protein
MTLECPVRFYEGLWLKYRGLLTFVDRDKPAIMIVIRRELSRTKDVSPTLGAVT